MEKAGPNWILIGAGALLGGALVCAGAGKLTPWAIVGAAVGGGGAWVVFDGGQKALWAHLEALVSDEPSEAAPAEAPAQAVTVEDEGEQDGGDAEEDMA